jgi:rhodanese-related sulfurtransferase
MRIYFTFFLTLILTFGLTACGGGDTTNTTNTDLTSQDMTSPTDKALEQDKQEEEENQPGPFQKGEFGDINLTKQYQLPENALFLDIRNEWERESGNFAKGSIGGAVYEFRIQGDSSQNYIRDEFVDEVLELANNNKNQLIILICSSGSRTGARGNHTKDSAAKLLSENGFTNVYHIMGGLNGSNGWKENDLPLDSYEN